MKAIKRAVYFLLGLSLIYYFILQIRAIWPFTIDDMYISLRYANHWAEGYGLVWNIGEPPVEGYSNFLFVMIAKFCIEWGINPIIVLKVAGIGGLIFTCLAVYLITRFWFVNRLALITCFWLLLYKGQIVWTVSGLETTVYQALLCFSVFFIFRGLGYNLFPKPRQGIRPYYFMAAALCLAVAGLTRPETPALMVLFTILIAINLPQPRTYKNLRGLFTFCLTLFVLFAPYFLWRLNYYGRLFPNSVYCKGFIHAADLTLVKQYWLLAWPFMILAVIGVCPSHDRRHYFLWLPGILYSLMLMRSDPIVSFYSRLFLPAFGLILPLTLYGLQRAVCHFFAETDYIQSLVIYFSAFLVAFFFIPSFSLKDLHQFSLAPQAGEMLRLQVVDWLKQNVSAKQPVVLGDSGLIPYRSSNPFIDSYCLNNAKMTERRVTSMYENFCEDVLKTQLQTLILTSLIEKGVVNYAPADHCLAEKIPQNENYCWSATFEAGSKEILYRYEIFTKKAAGIVKCAPGKKVDTWKN